ENGRKRAIDTLGSTHHDAERGAHGGRDDQRRDEGQQRGADGRQEGPVQVHPLQAGKPGARSRERHRALRTDKLPHDNEQPKREQAGQAAHPPTARLSWPPGRARWTAKTRKALTAKPSAPLVMAYAHVRSGRSACWVLIR